MSNPATPPSPAASPEAVALIDWLVSKKQDRGALAALRAALSPARQTQAWPLLARFGGVGDSRSARLVQAIAGLYAAHPDHTPQSGDFGVTCRRLARQDNGDLSEAFERRFQSLLASDRDEVIDRLPAFILRAKAEGVPVNYLRLHDDLTYWGDKVKARWGRAFWVGTKSNSEEAAEPFAEETAR